MILTQEQRANLREFFDHDKTNVFEVFIKLCQDKLRKQSALGVSEWDTIVNTVTKEAKITALDEILELLNLEMADQEVENAN